MAKVRNNTSNKTFNVSSEEAKKLVDHPIFGKKFTIIDESEVVTQPNGVVKKSK